jgi:uncharacterized protein
VIFIDSNVPMYLVGAAHPHKTDAQRALERLVAGGERLVTDAEVLQEVLHRYAAMRRRESIQPAFDALRGVVDEIFPVGLETVERAKALLLGHASISAREAVHLAAMEQHGVARILTFDAGFDGLQGIERLSG